MTQYSINSCADNMLNKINNCIDNKIKTLPKISGAIVSSVGNDGKISVYIPPDNDTVFTNISNQTPFELSVGDSVELLLKDGSLNNCWVIAKHKATKLPEDTLRQMVREIVQEVLVENNIIDKNK